MPQDCSLSNFASLFEEQVMGRRRGSPQEIHIHTQSICRHQITPWGCLLTTISFVVVLGSVEDFWVMLGLLGCRKFGALEFLLSPVNLEGQVQPIVTEDSLFDDTNRIQIQEVVAAVIFVHSAWRVSMLKHFTLILFPLPTPVPRIRRTLEKLVPYFCISKNF